MKRIVIGLSVFLGLFLLAGGGYVFFATRHLNAHRIELERLTELAKVSSLGAHQRMEAGDYDLRITIGRPLIENILSELNGFESVTRRGNRLQVTGIKSIFEDGILRLQAEANFSSPFYKGPVEATYLAFTQFLADGRCQLQFRPESARPTGSSILKGAWLEALIIARLEMKMPLPEINLPLDFAREIELPEVDRAMSKHEIRIRIPTRSVPLAVENPTVVVTPDYLGFIAGKIEVGNEVVDGIRTIATQHDQVPDGIAMELRFRILSELIQRLMEPDKDAFVSADHISEVWKKDKKVLGIKVKNRADLHQLNGYLDVRDGSLHIEDRALAMDLDISGFVEGVVKGKAYGVRIDSPFEVSPSLMDRIPVHLSSDEKELRVTFVEKELELDMDITLEIAGREVSFSHDLEFNTAEVFRPVVVPHWLKRSTQIPTRLERKKVTATKEVPVVLDWDLQLPDDEAGFLVFRGLLSVEKE